MPRPTIPPFPLPTLGSLRLRRRLRRVRRSRLAWWLCAVAVGTARDMSEAGARKLFLASLLYQPVLLALMALDTVR